MSFVTQKLKKIIFVIIIEKKEKEILTEKRSLLKIGMTWHEWRKMSRGSFYTIMGDKDNYL